MYIYIYIYTLGLAHRPLIGLTMLLTLVYVWFCWRVARRLNYESSADSYARAGATPCDGLIWRTRGRARIIIGVNNASRARDKPSVAVHSTVFIVGLCASFGSDVVLCTALGLCSAAIYCWSWWAVGRAWSIIVALEFYRFFAYLSMCIHVNICVLTRKIT